MKMNHIKLSQKDILFLSRGLGSLIADGKKVLALGPVESESDLIQMELLTLNIKYAFDLLTRLQLYV